MESIPYFLHPPATPQSLSQAHSGWKLAMDGASPWQQSGKGWLALGPGVGPVHVFEECTSVLDAGWKLAGADELDEWGSVLAVRQTSGRGQMRRNWSSPAGNLYAALLLPQLAEEHSAWGPILPVLYGMLFAESLDVLGVRAVLKWPNDLVVRGRKAGGMLLEDRGGKTLLGLGVNLVSSPPREELRKDFALEAGVVFAENATPSIFGVWSTLVDYTKKRYVSLLDGSLPQDFISGAEQRLAWMGREVLVQEGSVAAYAARIRGLSTTGGLVVTHEGKESVIFSGSILPM